MALLTPTPAEAVAKAIPNPNNVAGTARACRRQWQSFHNIAKSTLSQIDKLVTRGGGVAAIQAELSAGDFTVLSGCYAALRTCALSLAPGTRQVGGVTVDYMPDWGRDRTAEIAALPAGRVMPAADAATAAMNVLRTWNKSGLRILRQIDANLVAGQGRASVEGVMGTPDMTEMQTCYDTLRTICLDIDPGLTVPAFTRDRTAEIAQKVANWT